MNSLSSPKVWLLRLDFYPEGKAGISVDIDFESSDFAETKLWELTEPWQAADKKLVYKVRGKRWDKLDRYDLYPASQSVLVVSERMKNAIHQLCGPKQVASQPCEIRNSSGEIRLAWNLYPLNCIWCVDRKMTIAKWYIPDLVPEEVSIDYTEHLVLNPDCMGDLHIVRLRECKSNILVSDELKTVMEKVNRFGLEFVPPENAVLGGFKPLDWDQIIAKH